MIIFLFAVSLIGFCLFKNKQDFKETIHTKEEPITSPTNNIQKIEIYEKEYFFALIQITSLDNIFLYPNFEEKYTLKEGAEKYGCKNLTSAGFYKENNVPIGLFINEAGILGNKEENTLFNGYFILTKNNEATISKSYVGEPVRIGLQAGPLLVQNGHVQKLTLVNDEMARRIVVAQTKEGEIYFLVVYDKESVFMGPLLADLPEIVSRIQEEIGVEFISALNLDGGSASAFYTEDMQLSELTPIGGFFCEK
jgi:exopolysaccharide biosynthesis protein